MSTNKRFATKFKKGFIKHVCILKFLVKIDKGLLKLDKNLKFAKSMKSMEILQDKSKMSLSILNDMGVIIPDPNTMKSNDMAS